MNRVEHMNKIRRMRDSLGNSGCEFEYGGSNYRICLVSALDVLVLLSISGAYVLIGVVAVYQVFFLNHESSSVVAAASGLRICKPGRA